jgi:hypothetical protein
MSDARWIEADARAAAELLPTLSRFRDAIDPQDTAD